MNNRKRRGGVIQLAVTALLVVAFPLVSWAGEFIVFGPENFVRDRAKPFPENQTFTIPNAPTEYRLRIFNGGEHGEFKRVSSAIVWLNGARIVGPKQFNQTVSKIVVPVTPSAQNHLAVELRSLPGSGFALQVIGIDNDPPILSDFMPSDGETLPDPEVNLTGMVSDPLSGVDTVTCNANNTTEEAFVNTEEPLGEGVFVFACSLPLVLGPNFITVQATDIAGNIASSFLTIHHVLRPNVTIDSPGHLSFHFSSPITVTGTVDDPGATVTVNDIPASVTDGAFTASVPLGNGFHTITAVAQNVAGSGSDSVRIFVIVGLSPTVRILSPAQGFVLGAAEPNPVPVTVRGWVRDNRLFPGEPLITVRFNNSPVTAAVSQGPSAECLSTIRCWTYNAMQEFPSPTGVFLSIEVEAQTGDLTASRQRSGIVDFCVECRGDACVSGGACGASLFQQGCRQSRRCIVNADGCSNPVTPRRKDDPTRGTLGRTSTAFGQPEDPTSPEGALTVFGQRRPIQLPCNRHDECYHQRCPQEQTRGGVVADKKACNVRFLNDMRAVCKRAYPEAFCPVDRIGLLNCPQWRLEKTRCYAWARRYFAAVQADTLRYFFLGAYQFPYRSEGGDPKLTPCEGCPPIE